MKKIVATIACLALAFSSFAEEKPKLDFSGPLFADLGPVDQYLAL